MSDKPKQASAVVLQGCGQETNELLAEEKAAREEKAKAKSQAAKKTK